MATRLRTRCILLGALLVVSGAEADNSRHEDHVRGTVSLPISCSQAAQAVFDEGLILLHHMTYPQAQADFERAAAIDPQCAMAHWGIAMTLFQPLWPTRPGAAALQRGWKATQIARRLRSSEREQLYIAAAEAFFREPSGSDYWLRIRRWEAAQQQLYQTYPDDDEAAAFYALAHLATAPSNTTSREHADRAAEILVRVYEHNPDHPGAMHYLVHANDVPGRERALLAVTRKYETAAPDNPHALHMPTHIYTRLGDWDAAIRGNRRAAEAALKYPAGEHGEFVWDEFAHAIEYLVYAHLQKGEDRAAFAQIQRLQETARLEPTFKTAFHRASTAARYALERRDWSAAFAIEPRTPAALDWDRFGWPEAISRFAHGLGAIHVARPAVAHAQIARLDTLEQRMRASGEDLFARNIRLLNLELQAWLAHGEDDGSRSLALMQQAVQLEASTPKHAVTPGPTLPADEQLGDLLLDLHRPNDALAAYRRSIARYPNRLNSLLGAARAAHAANQSSASQALYRTLLIVAPENEREGVLQEARERTQATH